MSQFKKNLATLPSIDHLARLEIKKADSMLTIENKPGKSGSLAVYNYLNAEFGAMTPAAAQRGLEIFGEYTEEAKLNPGSHPNIDFLFKVIGEGGEYQISLVEK